MTDIAQINAANLRNEVRVVRIATGIYKQLLLSHSRVYILTVIDGCSEAGRREDLHADEESTESFAS